ncbi:hypothetical protein GRF29_96g208373 [Pseudopithomyces chartarum]|uniref:Uncharacterized protein n=1 Tax=Pseudopithomyces chartarum TaxID=1892770 RepID=A0AAN6LXZ1_9PLEO|nr:hypothetical protein GRF29_96g208373 [Pseudopithomyces chartarum]
MHQHKIRVRVPHDGPTQQENPQGAPQPHELEGPHGEPGADVAAADARVEDDHLAGDGDDAEDAGHFEGVEDAVETGAEEGEPDDGGGDVEGAHGWGLGEGWARLRDGDVVGWGGKEAGVGGREYECIEDRLCLPHGKSGNPGNPPNEVATVAQHQRV